MHGTHFSPSSHTSTGNSGAFFFTCGMHTLKHTPTAFDSEVHALGIGMPPARTYGSGMHTPPAGQVSSSPDASAGTSAVGTQCAWPSSTQHAGSEFGSSFSQVGAHEDGCAAGPPAPTPPSSPARPGS